MAADKFFASLRETLPALFTRRSISILAIKKYEWTMKPIMLSLNCEPRLLRLIEWPIPISRAAAQEFDAWRIQLNQVYDRLQMLVA